jgi:hypothetical protein
MHGMTASDVLRAAQAVLYAYLELPGNETGGSLHIVMDDFNYEDEHVRHCVEHAEATFIPGAGARPDWHKEADPAGAAVARMLLTLSIEERAAINDARRCRCGHAMSLHHEDHGSWGLSCTGRCRSQTCPCEHAEQVAAAP